MTVFERKVALAVLATAYALVRKNLITLEYTGSAWRIARILTK